jgi:transposase
LRLVGEDVAEMLELIASQLKVIETARLKKSCRQCERIVQPAAPMRPIPRGMAGPGLLARILVGKFDDHLPLYRRGEILARQGADIPRSTLIDWCGQAIAVLRPLVKRIRADVMHSDRLHADDTPIRVLDPAVRQTRGKAKAVKEGRLWVSTSVTTGHGAAPIRRRPPTTSRPTAGASTRSAISPGSPASCRRTPMAGSPSCTSRR